MKKEDPKVLEIMLHPGEIRSKSDGDRHYISALQLIRLYRVLPTDHVMTFDIKNPTHDREWQLYHKIKCIHLYPLRSGEYYDVHEYDDVEVQKPLKEI